MMRVMGQGKPELSQGSKEGCGGSEVWENELRGRGGHQGIL